MRGLWIAALIWGCDDGGAGSTDGGPPDGALPVDAVQLVDARLGVADAAPPDAAPPDATAPDAGPPTADEYCERTVDLFCDYYLRCGRMAVPDVPTCRRVFLEACNAVYEPVYRAYAERGALTLSAAGIAACADHLGGVACTQQLFDLDGGCQGMWVGQVPAGGACGPGIGSFVCAPGTTCVLGLDLCGTCEAHAPLDGSCVDQRCAADAACVRDVCVPRARVGEACAEVPCVAGAACVDDRCQGFTTVAVGDPCDRARRCPYKSECVAGTCVESALLGEPCGEPVACASGVCAQRICAPLRAEGEPCAAGGDCVGGICQGGACAPAVGPCFTSP